MKRSGKTVQCSGVGQERVRERGANQVTRVGLTLSHVPFNLSRRTYRDIPTLVVRVDGQVQPHQIDKFLVVSISQHTRQIRRVILFRVDRGEFP